MGKCVLRVSNGKNSIKNREYAANFQFYGFKFVEKGYNSYFEKEFAEEDSKKLDVWLAYCRKNKLRSDVFDTKYTRSDNYRDVYFKHNKPSVEAKYRCAYCGRKLRFKDTTIDHVFPVNKMMYSSRIRKIAQFFGIDETNQKENLVCSCRSCNSKKGTKTGIWVVLGFIGKHEWLWKTRIFVRYTLIAVLLFFIIRFLDPNGNLVQSTLHNIANLATW